MKKMPSGSYLIQFIDVAAHKDTTVKLLRSTTSLNSHQTQRKGQGVHNITSRAGKKVC